MLEHTGRAMPYEAAITGFKMSLRCGSSSWCAEKDLNTRLALRHTCPTQTMAAVPHGIYTFYIPESLRKHLAGQLAYI